MRALMQDPPSARPAKKFRRERFHPRPDGVRPVAG